MKNGIRRRDLSTLEQQIRDADTEKEPSDSNRCDQVDTVVRLTPKASAKAAIEARSMLEDAPQPDTIYAFSPSTAAI